MLLSELSKALEVAKTVAGDVELVLRHVEEAGVSTVVHQIEFALTGSDSTNVVTLAHGPAHVVLDPTPEPNPADPTVDTSAVSS